MPDPLSGDGAFVLQRTGNATVVYALSELDITVNNKLDPTRFGGNEHSMWGGSRELVFSGKGPR